MKPFSERGFRKKAAFTQVLYTLALACLVSFAALAAFGAENARGKDLWAFNPVHQIGRAHV